MKNILDLIRLFENNEFFEQESRYEYFTLATDEDIKKYNGCEYGRDYFIFLVKDKHKAAKLCSNINVLNNLIRLGLVEPIKYSVSANLNVGNNLLDEKKYCYFIYDKPGVILFVKGYEVPTYFDVYCWDENV